MTHNPVFLGKDKLTYLLWSMIPETRAFCPRGLGIIPYCLPSSFELANATLKELEEYDVVMWEKHGVISVSENLSEAFDMVDTLSKAAQIFLMAKTMGFQPCLPYSGTNEELKNVF
jgi:rhamnulose-1-phosphate aldolase